MWEAWAVIIFQGTVPSGWCRRYKIGLRSGRHCNFAATVPSCRYRRFFNEMPSGRYFNFATIVSSGRHFSHCDSKSITLVLSAIFEIRNGRIQNLITWHHAANQKCSAVLLCSADSIYPRCVQSVVLCQLVPSKMLVFAPSANYQYQWC